jgi:hypothetical protein
VRYGCEKITRYNEDDIRIGKQGSIWDNGDTWNNATAKWKGSLRFLENKCHNFSLTTPICMNESFPCSL